MRPDPFIIAQRPSGVFEIWRRKRTRYYLAATLKRVNGVWEISGPRVAYGLYVIDEMRSVLEGFHK